MATTMTTIIDLTKLHEKPLGSVVGMIDEDLLIPEEWRALVRSLLPGRMVEITLVSGLNRPGYKLNGCAAWLKGNSFEIQMMFESFMKRSLDESFRTFLHECAHVKHTVGQSSSHTHEVFMNMIPDDELTEVIGKGTEDPTFPSEYVANKQRDLWLEEAEEAVGKDASWREKARYLAYDKRK